MEDKPKRRIRTKEQIRKQNRWKEVFRFIRDTIVVLVAFGLLIAIDIVVSYICAPPQPQNSPDFEVSHITSIPHQPIPEEQSIANMSVYEDTEEASPIATRDDIAEWVMVYSAMYEVDPELVMAVMYVESEFDINAYNDGCVGLMQVSEENAEWYREDAGVTDIYDPQQNIHAGVFHLSYVLNRYDGNVNMALMAYNMGGGRANELFWQYGVYECKYTRDVMEVIR